MTENTAAAFGRSLGATRSGSSATTVATSASLRPSRQALSTARSWVMDSSPMGPGRSMTRCSTRPVLVMSTSSSRRSASGTSSTCRTDDLLSDGYWTTATCRVSCASNRTVRITTSSRS